MKKRKYPSWFVVYRKISKRKEAVYCEMVLDDCGLKKAISSASKTFPEKEYFVELQKKEPFIGW
jgi:hypothetical protein